MHEMTKFSHLICNLLKPVMNNERNTQTFAYGVLLILKFLFVSLAGYKGETIHCLKSLHLRQR